MKKKILCLTAAIVMAMSTTAFAADTDAAKGKSLTLPARDSGNVTDVDTKDAGEAAAGDYYGLTAYDAAVIYEYSQTGKDETGEIAANGNYDGDMIFGKTEDKYVTASDALTVLKTVKNPNLKIDKVLKVYTSSSKFPGDTYVINENDYNDDTTLPEALNTLLTTTIPEKGKDKVESGVNKVINTMTFYSEDLDRNVKLTEEGGWQIFVQAIEPLLALNGRTEWSTEHTGWIDLEKSEGESYENLKKIQDIIVKDKSAELTLDQIKEISELAQKAVPGDKVTAEAAKSSYANVKKMVAQKYNVDGVKIKLNDKNATYTVDELVNYVCDENNNLLNYSNVTLANVIDNFGTSATATAKDGKIVAKAAVYERAMSKDVDRK